MNHGRRSRSRHGVNRVRRGRRRGGLPAPIRALLAAIIVQATRDFSSMSSKPADYASAQSFLSSDTCEGLCSALHFPYNRVKRLLLDTGGMLVAQKRGQP